MGKRCPGLWLCSKKNTGLGGFPENTKSCRLSPGAKGSPAFAGTLPGAEHVRSKYTLWEQAWTRKGPLTAPDRPYKLRDLKIAT